MRKHIQTTTQNHPLNSISVKSFSVEKSQHLESVSKNIIQQQHRVGCEHQKFDENIWILSCGENIEVRRRIR